MASLHSDRAGAIAPTLLPFPRTESRDDSDLPELTKLLGKIYTMHDGVVATVVRADAAIPKQALDASYALNASSPILREVGLAGAGEVICGFTFPGTKDIAEDELFLMMIPVPGQGRVTVVPDAGAVSAGGKYLIAGIVGTVDESALYDETLAPGVQILKTLEAAGAGVPVDVMVCAPTVF